MPIQLYLNHNVPNAILEGLRLRGVEVLSAYEDGAHRLPDPELLDRATQLGRVLFSMDRDLLIEAARRQRTGEGFAGVVYAHQQSCPIGRCIDDLEILAKATEPDDFHGLLQYLPL